MTSSQVRSSRCRPNPATALFVHHFRGQRNEDREVKAFAQDGIAAARKWQS